MAVSPGLVLVLLPVAAGPHPHYRARRIPTPFRSHHTNRPRSGFGSWMHRGARPTRSPCSAAGQAGYGPSRRPERWSAMSVTTMLLLLLLQGAAKTAPAQPDVSTKAGVQAEAKAFFAMLDTNKD